MRDEGQRTLHPDVTEKRSLRKQSQSSSFWLYLRSCNTAPPSLIELPRKKGRTTTRWQLLGMDAGKPILPCLSKRKWLIPSFKTFTQRLPTPTIAIGDLRHLKSSKPSPLLGVLCVPSFFAEPASAMFVRLLVLPPRPTTASAPHA